MNIEIIVTHTLAPELMALLQGFIKGQVSAAPTPALSVKAEAKENVKAVPSPAPASAPDPAKEETPAPTATGDISLEMVRAAVVTKTQSGKREEVKSLLTEFSAAKVTDLKKEQYADFLQRINSL